MRFRRFINIHKFWLILFFFFCTQTHGSDYYFIQSDSIIFSTDDSLVRYQIYDVNGDSLDEIFALYESCYYLYSFQLDSIMFSDTSGNYHFSGGLIVDNYDLDSNKHLLLTNYNRDLLIQDGFVEHNSRILTGFHYVGLGKPRMTLYFGDINSDLQNELIVTGLGYYFDGITWSYEYIYSGDMLILNSNDWSRIWNNECEHLWAREWDPCRPNGENTLFNDLNGDGKVEIIAWGRYFWYSYLANCSMDPYNDICIDSSVYQLFDVLDGRGNIHFSSFAPTQMTAITGHFSSLPAGEKIIVLKDGFSIDSTVFNPSGQYAFYCLCYVGDSIRLLWGKDASEYERNLFSIPSIPHTFCASTPNDQYSLRSGDDGSIIGTINGLRKGLNTSEGHFLPLDDSIIQLIQVDGDKVYLYKLTSKLDVTTDQNISLPEKFILFQNIPNPFNPSTTIEFELPTGTDINLEIFDILGRRIASLANGYRKAGHYSVEWDGNDSGGRPASSGVYICRLTTGDYDSTIRMVKLK